MWLWIWLAVVTLLAILLFSPILLRVGYRSGSEPDVRLRWLFLSIRYPQEEKPQRKRKMRTQPERKAKPKKEEKKTFSGEDLKKLVPVIASILPKALRLLMRSFWFYHVELDVLVAEEDAAQTALTYGKVNAAIYSLYGLARAALRMRPPEIQVRVSFTAQEGDVRLDARASLLPVRALAVLLRIAAAFLRALLRQKRDSANAT